MDAILAELERQGPIGSSETDLPGESAFRFGHALVRRVAERRLRRSDRAYLHERFADWLESRHADAVETDAMAGYHLEQAFQNLAELGPIDERGAAIGRRGSALLAHAGRRAADRGDGDAAERHYGRAAALLGSDTLERARLLFAEFGLGMPESPGTVIHEVRRILGLHADPALAAAVEVARCHLVLILDQAAPGGLRDASAAAVRAVDVLETAGDAELLCYALNWASFFAMGLGRAGDCMDYAERGYSVAVGAGLGFERAQALFFGLGHHLSARWPVDRCMARCRQALDENPDDLLVRAHALSHLACHLARAGGIAEARSLSNEALSIHEVFGRDRATSAFVEQRVSIEMYAGDWDAVVEWAEPFVAQVGLVGSNVEADMAHALAMCGRYEEAVERAMRADTLENEPDDFYPHCVARAVQVFVAAARGNSHVDFGPLSHAENRLRVLDVPEVLADVVSLEGQALSLVGRPEEALIALNEAIGIYDALGVSASAERVRALATEIAT